MRPANRAERTLDASARGRAMRLAAQTDVRHSLPRSRRFQCLCTRSDTVLSSKNLSKRRRPTPRYRYFQIDTKNGRLTPIRIVLARNILRAHPTLVPKRGCVSAPAMVPLWSGLFSVAPCGERLSEHCARPATAESPVAGQRVRPGSRASSHARRPTSRASRKIPPHEPRTVTASQPPVRKLRTSSLRKAFQKSLAFVYPAKTRAHRSRTPASPARCIVDMKSR